MLLIYQFCATDMSILLTCKAEYDIFSALSEMFLIISSDFQINSISCKIAIFWPKRCRKTGKRLTPAISKKSLITLPVRQVVSFCCNFAVSQEQLEGIKQLAKRILNSSYSIPMCSAISRIRSIATACVRGRLHNHNNFIQRIERNYPSHR